MIKLPWVPTDGFTGPLAGNVFSEPITGGKPDRVKVRVGLNADPCMYVAQCLEGLGYSGFFFFFEVYTSMEY